LLRVPWKAFLKKLRFGTKGWQFDVRFWAGYKSNMNVEKIRKRISGGFRPFVLQTSDGREYQIPHPEFIFLTRGDVIVVDGNGDIDILDPLHITSIRVMKPGSTPASKQ
jgi:hypothetical protein